MLDTLADEGGVMGDRMMIGVYLLCKSVAAIACYSALSCTPSPTTPPTSSDACAVDERITQSRLIRTDSGAPLVLPGCLDGGK